MNLLKLSLSVFLTLVTGGCDLLDNDSGKKNGSSENKTVFVLCEGEFGAPNASVWSIDLVTRDHAGPLHWTVENPLGDTGQSLKVHEGKLYIVVNNSHSVEVLDLGSGTPEYEGTLHVPNASPRYLEIVGDKGYLTCWGLNGILVFNPENLDIMDTISVGGWPEMIMNTQWGLFVTVPMRSYSDYADIVLVFDPDNMSAPADTFSVVPGPVSLLVSENHIYVASTYYDEYYNTYSGISRIDPLNKTVLKNDSGQSFGIQKSLVEINDSVYRLTYTGLARVSLDLSLDQAQSPIQIKGGYSASVFDSKLFIGLTDYSAPDTVVVYSESFILDTLYQVKVLPTDFEFYDPEE